MPREMKTLNCTCSQMRSHMYSVMQQIFTNSVFYGLSSKNSKEKSHLQEILGEVSCALNNIFFLCIFFLNHYKKPLNIILIFVC